MKTGLGNWSRKFFPRLHREGLNSNEKEKKKIKKKRKKKKERKKEEKRAKIYIVIKFECETASRGMFIRKKKKGERKKGEGFAEKRGRNVESTVFRRVLSESFVFSRPAENTHKCVSPRWKSALLPYLARSPREEATIPSFQTR